MEYDRLKVPGISEEDCTALARTGKLPQYCRSVADLLIGRCPFCTINPEVNSVQIENEAWRMWPNIASPEKHTRNHLLVVPRRHVLDLQELGTREWMLLQRMLKSSLAKYGITSSGLLLRNGDATRSAGTIRHLHFHIMEPDGTGRVESPFFKGEASEAESHARAIIFERLRTGEVVVADLRPEEFELVEGRLQ